MVSFSCQIQGVVSMPSVGLTGGLSTGKSTVALMFKELGANVVSADSMVHSLMKPEGSCYHQIVKVFGTDICKNNKIDRHVLANIVFSDFKLLKKLEKIVHPFVKREILALIQQNHHRIQEMLIVEIPLLFESDYWRKFDKTIVVSSTKKQQVERAIQKIGITKSQALQRIQLQMPLARKKQMADFVINNRGNKTDTKIQVKKIWQQIQMQKN